MQPIYEQERAVTYEEVTVGDKIWQMIRFFVVTGLIFAVSFFALNYQAYTSILANVLKSETQVEAQRVLTASSAKVDPDLLLPVIDGEAEIQKHYVWYDFPVVPTDNRLVIPKLGKSVPIVNMSAEHIEGENWAELEKQIQSGLQQGVVHYPGTAAPGQVGNVFITGHSSYYPWDPGQFKDVFAVLGQLEIGDEYYVYYDQKKYTYKVREKFEVQPDNVNVLQQPHDKKVSTLMTCTPVGTTLRRLIIRADDIS
ncbi:sortase [Candidatus Peregrinibacteria bacterium]|nr:sortase [Candidatus Peregrinibacteria bacterium]